MSLLLFREVHTSAFRGHLAYVCVKFGTMWKWISVRQHSIIINGMAICHAVFCCANIKYNLFNGSFCNIPIRHTSQLPKTYFFFLFLSIDAFSASRFLLIYNVIFKATSTNMQFTPFELQFTPFLFTFKKIYVTLKCKNLCVVTGA